MLLELRNVTKRFGGLMAVDDFSMSVERGEIIGLIGPNGAGKTTVFNLITGFLKPDGGEIIFDGQRINGFAPYKIARMGIARTFQHNPLFEEFTVLENLIASFHVNPRASILQTFLNTQNYRKNEALIYERALEISKLLGLEAWLDKKAKDLPHGLRVILGVARAMAVTPKLLLLDEPTSGMAPHEMDRVVSVIERLNKEGLSIILVEHNMDIIDICSRVIVMNFGKKIAEGTVQEIRSNKDVIEAYLGVSDGT